MLLFDTKVKTVFSELSEKDCLYCLYLNSTRWETINCCLFSGHIDVVKFLTDTCKVDPFVEDR